MSNGVIIILCLIGIALSIFLNLKLDLSLGICAFVFAFLIGCLGMGLKFKEVVAMFPTSVYFQVLCLTLFFGFGVVNGTMNAVANHMLYATRNRPWMISFVLFAIGNCLGIIGCVPPAAGAILAVMIFTIAVPAGMHPLIGCAAAYGNNCGSFIPWGASGAIISATIAAQGYSDVAQPMSWKIFIFSVLASLLLVIICFFVFKGYNMRPLPNMEKPEPFSQLHKRNLIVICIVLFFAVVPGVLKGIIGGAFLTTLTNICDMQFLCLAGFLVCTVLKLADQKKVIAAVPWNTLLLLAGISTLMSVAVKAGAVEIITSWLSANVPAFLLPLFLCLLGGFLSAFSGGITTVFPMLAPMVPALVATTAMNPVYLFTGIVFGAHFTGMSPFSTGGAVFLSQCRDDSMAKKLVTGQLFVSLVGLVLGMVLITAATVIIG